MNVRDFSFAPHADGFDKHIRDSIPGLEDLRAICVGLSRNFVLPDTTVVDIGCSTGSLLRSIRDANQVARPSVRYVGIDTEREFLEQWRKRSSENIRFQVADARSFEGFENLSVAFDLFTLQFIPERDRFSLLRRVHDGLIEGGALIIAEKTLANSARFQDMLTFEHYDHKRLTFTAEEILDKERGLRGQMTLWTEAQLLDALCEAGFQSDELQRFWQNDLFLAYVARKSRAPRSMRTSNHSVRKLRTNF